MIRGVIAVLVGLVLVEAPAYRTSIGQVPTFLGRVAVVTLDVSVKRGRRPVSGLAARDFVVLDNGVRQVAEIVPADRVPLDVSVVFDVSAFAQWGLRYARDLRDIAAMIRPQDRLRVIAFATTVREVVPMASLGLGRPDRALPEALSSWMPAAVAGRAGRLDLHHTPALRYQSLSDAILFALSWPAEPGRRHIVQVFSSVADKRSILFRQGLLQPIVERSDALLQVATWNPRDVSAPWLVERYTWQALIAAASSGGEVLDATDAADAFRRVLDDFRSRYILRYTATGVDPGGWHEVTVRVPEHPEYEIRARKGYLGR